MLDWYQILKITDNWQYILFNVSFTYIESFGQFNMIHIVQCKFYIHRKFWTVQHNKIHIVQCKFYIHRKFWTVQHNMIHIVQCKFYTHRKFWTVQHDTYCSMKVLHTLEVLDSSTWYKLFNVSLQTLEVLDSSIRYILFNVSFTYTGSFGQFNAIHFVQCKFYIHWNNNLARPHQINKLFVGTACMPKIQPKL